MVTKQFRCPKCKLIRRYLEFHHKSYPPLARKFNYKGFDHRMMLNHPEKIEVLCSDCHSEVHNK